MIDKTLKVLNYDMSLKQRCWKESLLTKLIWLEDFESWIPPCHKIARRKCFSRYGTDDLVFASSNVYYLEWDKAEFTKEKSSNEIDRTKHFEFKVAELNGCVWYSLDFVRVMKRKNASNISEDFF